MLQRKYMYKNRSIVRTVSIEAVLQPRFHYAMNYFSFDAEVLFAFFVFGDTFTGVSHFRYPLGPGSSPGRENAVMRTVVR